MTDIDSLMKRCHHRPRVRLMDAASARGRETITERRERGDPILLRALSLGAGVQSTALALMAAHGEITPMPDVALFADTQWEPSGVYEHLSWLSSANVLPYPVIRVSAGSLRDNVLTRRNTSGGRYAAIPWHTLKPDGSAGMGRRQCTSEYKLTPLMHGLRDLLGVDRRDRIPPGSVEVWIGISTDEASRMRPARQQWMRNRYPLAMELRMSRSDCLAWMDRHSYPRPAKSACIGCPYKSAAEWRHMHDHDPAAWADAVEIDTALRVGDSRGMRVVEFMHPQRVPLAEADLSAATEHGQGDLFGNECEGMCGL